MVEIPFSFVLRLNRAFEDKGTHRPHCQSARCAGAYFLLGYRAEV